MVLITITLSVNYVEHFSCAYLSSIHFSLVKYLFKYFANLFVFLLLSCQSSLYILNTSSYQIYTLQIFFSVCGLPFHYLNSVFQRTEVENFYEVKFIGVCILICIFCVLSKNSLPSPRSQRLPLCFFLEIV